MNRRSFLRALGFWTVSAAAASAGLIDVEQLLWTPGEKTIFLPTPASLTPAEYLAAGERLNELVSCDWLAKEYLAMMNKELEFAKRFTRDYHRVYDNHGSQVGDSIAVRLPARIISFP